MILVVKCPNCGRYQLFQPKTKDYNKWVKKCVYCGYSFKVNPKSKYSSSIIIKVFDNTKEAQAFLKILKEKEKL